MLPVCPPKERPLHFLPVSGILAENTDSLKAGEGMTLAIFDFDGTMIQGDSIVRYLAFARKAGLLSFGQLIRAGLAACLFRLGLTDAKRAKSAALSFRKGAPRSARRSSRRFP